MNRIFFILLSAGLIVIPVSKLIAQENEPFKAVEIGAGLSISDDNSIIGGGYNFSVAYHRSFKNQRFHFTPGFDVAFLGARMVMDVPDMYFNSINMELPVSFDLLKIGVISVYIDAGPAFNYKKGLIGTGGYPPGRTESDYITQGRIYLRFGTGLHISPRGEKYFVRISPINFRVDPDENMEGFNKISLGFLF